jgi:virginiamycin B lyase
LQDRVRRAGVFSLVCLSFGLVVQGQQSQRLAAGQLRQMTTLRPIATFHVGSDPDWMAVTEDAVWVTTSGLNRVTQLKVDGNAVGLAITINQPCSGLIAGFGSLWIPSCGTHSLIRADLKTGQILATVPIGPADSEGGITVGAGSVWIMSSPAGVLSRIDATTNSVAASIDVPSGSSCPIFADGFVWVTSTEHGLLSKVDPSSNHVVAKISVGRNPRFATAGAGSVWTLNQGDGTISRVDTKTGKLVANIRAGLPGHGGEITFGFGAVWAHWRAPPSRASTPRTIPLRSNGQATAATASALVLARSG